ncbi:hypothetical protein GCM10007061_17940 [Kocuria marina]|nr:hypothetical protein GCM10007061_17940 [Kocuria marina]
MDLVEFTPLAQSGPSDAGGLTFLRYLDGERTPNLPTAQPRMRSPTGWKVLSTPGA